MVFATATGTRSRARLQSLTSWFRTIQTTLTSLPLLPPGFNLAGMEKPESSMGGGSMIELEDRDPNNLNQHLQVGKRRQAF